MEQKQQNLKRMKLSTKYQQIILASSSQARIEYLEHQRINFQIRPHKIDENIIKKKKLPFTKIVETLAKSKAQSVIEKKDELIIGSDQILICESKLINKPRTINEAKQNLIFLRNKKHKLISSVVVIFRDDIVFKETKEAILQMKNISDNDIEIYLAKNKQTALNCVGSYKIEENNKYNFLEVIEGDQETIIGFPARKFIERIKK
jgi:septum formation protein